MIPNTRFLPSSIRFTVLGGIPWTIDVSEFWLPGLYSLFIRYIQPSISAIAQAISEKTHKLATSVQQNRGSQGIVYRAIILT